MKYVSTRSPDGQAVDLVSALHAGLAADGGLYVPQQLPRVDIDQAGATLPETAAKVLAPFLDGSELAGHLSAICQQALSIELPLQRFGEQPSWLLELFHGPTAAFKDFAARFLAACLARLQQGDEGERTVLVATSGDTGGAVAAAFHGLPGFRVVVLYPQGRVSARQAHQLEAFGDNVLTLRVAGDFDDCQRMVKAALSDPALRQQLRPTSANSISIGRLLPQISYYAHASLSLAAELAQPVNVIVPTGNLGNALACILARQIGLPIGEVHLATNANRTLVDFFDHGDYQGRASLETLANAMDVGDPSNFERLRWLMQQYPDAGRDLRASSIDDATIAERIRKTDAELDLAVCPHTACAMEVLSRLRQAGDHRPWMVAATAHSAKFEAVVEPLLGRELPLPPALAELLQRPRQAEDLPASDQALAERLMRG